jgi:elongation factor Tu
MTVDPLFRMTVQDVFSIAKRGTVVTGTIERGTLRVGDEVAINGKNGEKRTTVASIEAFRKLLDEANTGDAVGILLKDIAKQDVQRGDVILCPGPDFTWKT